MSSPFVRPRSWIQVKCGGEDVPKVVTADVEKLHYKKRNAATQNSRGLQPKREIILDEDAIDSLLETMEWEIFADFRRRISFHV